MTNKPRTKELRNIVGKGIIAYNTQILFSQYFRRPSQCQALAYFLPIATQSEF